MGRVIGFHLVMTYYGFWLPNDPRGSGSIEVRAAHLRKFGDVTYVRSERSVAWQPHDFEVRRLAKEALKYPAVELNGKQAKCVGLGIRKYLYKHDLSCFAFANMPDHVHLVIGQTKRSIDRTLTDLKGAATHELLMASLHPFQRYQDEGKKLPHLWAKGGRHVFLFDHDDVYRSINYVKENPRKAGLPEQHWTFVQDYSTH